MADVVDQNIPLLYVGSGVILTVLTLVVSLRQDLRAFFAEEPSLSAPSAVEREEVAAVTTGLTKQPVIEPKP